MAILKNVEKTGKEKFGVDERWTKALGVRGFTPVANTFLDSYSKLSPSLTHGEAMFLIHLIRYKWGANDPYPSLKTLATQMGVTAAMARRHARNIQQKKYLVRKMAKAQTNRYDLAPLFAALHKIVARDAVKAAALAAAKAADTEAVGMFGLDLSTWTQPLPQMPARAVNKPILSKKPPLSKSVKPPIPRSRLA